jgi:FtsH-binding integral membrane protein
VSHPLEIVWEIALLVAVLVVAVRMPRRKRGILIFLWLFMSGVLVLGEILVGITAPSVSLVIYGVALCAVGWYVKVRTTSPEQITA